MPLSPVQQEADARRWVRYHVIGFFATIGVVAGLLIVDSKIAQIIGDSQMPGFRAILLVSSDLPEIIGLSDRIVVMRGGRIVGACEGGASEEAVMALAVGHAAGAAIGRRDEAGAAS